MQPRPKLLPLFAGTSLFPSAGGDLVQSPSSSCGPVVAQHAGRSSGGASSPGGSSPVSSPTSEATGGPKISGLLSGGSSGVQAGGHMCDCAASEPPQGWHGLC